MVSPPYVGPVAHATAGSNKPIARIVIHCTVGADAKGSTGTVAYFKQQASTGSAHYVVDAQQILQCAWDSVICWHAPPNAHSLGYELCCSLTNQGKGHWDQQNHIDMMRIAAKSVADNCTAYAIPIRKLTVAQVRAGEKGICGHNDVSLAFGQSTHWDPGPYFPWNTFITMVKAAAGKPGKDEELDVDEATLRAIIADELNKQDHDLWIGPRGTGTKLLKDIADIKADVEALKAKE